MGVKKVMVLAETQEGFAQLCSGGRQLGEMVSAVVLGTRDEAFKIISMGADKIFWLGEMKSDQIFENYFKTISAVVENEKPGLLLVQATKRCAFMAGMIASGLGTSVMVDASDIDVSGESVQARHMIYGGAAFRTEKSSGKTAIATVPTGEFLSLPEDASRTGEIVGVDFIAPDRGFRLVKKEKKAVSSVNLNVARRVIGIGRGIAKEEDIRVIEELAGLLGAEVACSRPIAEGVNWLPRERYIGISGAMIKPDVYFAIGISGQVQHMVGVSQAKTIFAVNTDKNAMVFKQADYGIVGDLYKVVPVLIKKLRGA